jgi:hypothetical protein
MADFRVYDADLIINRQLTMKTPQGVDNNVKSFADIHVGL